MVSSVERLTEPARSVESVAYSPGGEWLGVGSQDGTLYVYDAKSWSVVERLRGRDAVFDVAWSPGGRWLLGLEKRGGQSGGRVAVWDTESWDFVAELEDPGFKEPFSVAFSPERRFLAVTHGDVVTGSGEVFVYDSMGVDPGEWGVIDVLRFEGEPGSRREFVQFVDFNLTGRRLAVVQRNKGSVLVFNTGFDGPGAWRRIRDVRTARRPFEAVFSGGGLFLGITDRFEGKMVVHETRGWTLLDTVFTEASAGPVAWAPTSAQVAVGDWGSPFQVGFWATVNFRQTGLTRDGHRNRINSLSWAPNNEAVVSGGQDGEVFVWSVPVPRRARSVPSSAFFESGGLGQQGAFVTDIRFPGQDLDEIFVGEPVEVVFVVGNPLNFPVQSVLVGTANDSTIGTVNVDLAPGETAEKTLVWTPQSVETDEVCGVVNGVRECTSVDVTINPSDIQRFLEEFGLELALPEEIEKFFLDPLRKMIPGL